MPEPKLQFIMSGQNAGSGESQRRVAVLVQEGAGMAAQPPVVWLGGFRSDMRATKAEALASWAAGEGRSFVRFDYSGHGESESDEPGNRFVDGTISRWLEDSLAVIGQFADRRPVLVGSSMGGWIALLAAKALAKAQAKAHAQAKALAGAGGDRQPSALVLVAPAVDFTEDLMWQAFPQNIRDEIMSTGQWLRPSAYSPEPCPITRALIEDGRNHLLFGNSITTGCPVHVLQGMADPDVPYAHALKLMEHLPGEGATLTLVKDGDHRLSRDQDIALLVETVRRAVSEG